MALFACTILRAGGTKKIKTPYYAIITIRQLIPSVGITQRISGLPLGEARAVVAEEKGVAETGDVGLAGIE